MRNDKSTQISVKSCRNFLLTVHLKNLTFTGHYFNFDWCKINSCHLLIYCLRNYVSNSPKKSSAAFSSKTLAEVPRKLSPWLLKNGNSISINYSPSASRELVIISQKESRKEGGAAVNRREPTTGASPSSQVARPPPGDNSEIPIFDPRAANRRREKSGGVSRRFAPRAPRVIEDNCGENSRNALGARGRPQGRFQLKFRANPDNGALSPPVAARSRDVTHAARA